MSTRNDQRHALPLLFAAMLALTLPDVLHADDKPADAEQDAKHADAPPPAEPEDAEPLPPLPPHLADSPAFRARAAKDTLCDLFGIKDQPGPGDSELDLLPPGTVPIDIINPGFEFTYEKGKNPGNNFWIMVVRKDQPGHIRGGMTGPSDPIQGWTAAGGAGLESGRPKQWITTPDGCTGYILAHEKDYTLHQSLDAALKPKTRYTLLLEVYKRNDFKRAELEQIILRLTDAKGNDLDIDTADYLINPADPATGFAITALTLTTTADQAPGDLTVHIGMNAPGNARFNFDNLRLWEQPLD